MKKRWLLASLVGVLVLGCLFAAWLFRDSVLSRAGPEEVSFEGRSVRQWRQALKEELAQNNKESQPARFALLHGGPEAVPVLAELLHDDDVELRRLAAGFLVNQFVFKNPETQAAARTAVPALTEALRDEDKTVRCEAAKALAYIGRESKPAVPRLAELLGDPDALVAYHASRALGAVGSEAREAVPALLKAHTDAREMVRKGADDALKRIDPEAATRAGIR